MVKVILVNGPPRSGKDTVGNIFQSCCRLNNVVLMKFAEILKDMCHRALNLNFIRHDAYELCKEIESEDFLGVSPREFYIAFSEKLMKPLFGKVIFGELLLKRMKKLSDDIKLIVVTDSGFREEVFPIADHYGAENVFLIRLKRNGCSFKNDSRNYFRFPGVRTIEIENNGSIQLLQRNIHSAFQNIPSLKNVFDPF